MEFIEMETLKYLAENNKYLDIGFIKFCHLIIKCRICNINVDVKVPCYFNTFITDKIKKNMIILLINDRG